MGDVFRQQKRANGRTTFSSKWYGEYRAHTGKRRRVPLATDKKAALAMLNDLVRRAERRRAGILDDFPDNARVPPGRPGPAVPGGHRPPREVGAASRRPAADPRRHQPQ